MDQEGLSGLHDVEMMMKEMDKNDTNINSNNGEA